MPTVSIEANALPPRSFAQSAIDQRGPDQPSQFASILNAQTDTPPPAATENNPPASPSPPAQADDPSREATNATSRTKDRKTIEPAEPSSGKSKGMAGAASVANDRPKGTKAKIDPKIAPSASAGSVLPATASPTPPAQAPAANALPADMTAAAAAAAGVPATSAPSITDGSDKDANNKDTSSGDAIANDATTQIVATPGPSTQNSQPAPNAALLTTTAPSQAVAGVAPAPMAAAGPTADATGSDPLAITGDTFGTTGRSQPTVRPPSLAPTLPLSPDVAGTPVSSAARKAASLIAAGTAPHSADAIPQTPAAAARPAAPPALGTEQTATITNTGVSGPATLAAYGADPDGPARDIAKPTDTSGDAGSTVQAQTANGVSVAGIATPTAASARNESAAAAIPVAEVAVTIATQAQSGKSRFEIRLDPPELGRIDVQLNVDSRGNVSSRLIVERPDTLNLLVRDAPQLQRALQDAGLNTAGGMQFSLADQGFASRNGFAQQNDFARPRPNRSAAADTAPIAALQGYAAWSSRNGGLDITV